MDRRGFKNGRAREINIYNALSIATVQLTEVSRSCSDGTLKHIYLFHSSLVHLWFWQDLVEIEQQIPEPNLEYLFADTGRSEESSKELEQGREEVGKAVRYNTAADSHIQRNASQGWILLLEVHKGP